MGDVLVFVLYITSLSTNEIGHYLTYLNYIPQRKSAARGTLTLDDIIDDFLGPCMYFLRSRSIDLLQKACDLSELLSLLVLLLSLLSSLLNILSLS